MIKVPALFLLISLKLFGLAHAFDESGFDLIKTAHKLLPEILLKLNKRDSVVAEERNRVIEQQRAIVDNHQLLFWGIGLLSGEDSVSKIIKKKTESEWSHVGLIFRDESAVSYFLEATGSLKKIVRQEIKPQIMLRKWDNVVANHKGKVALRQLITIYGWSPNPSKINKMLEQDIGSYYKGDMDHFIYAVDKHNENEPLSQYFASEMTAKWLMEICVISKSWQNAADYLPKDFSSKEELATTDQIRFINEMIVKKK